MVDICIGWLAPQSLEQNPAMLRKHSYVRRPIRTRSRGARVDLTPAGSALQSDTPRIQRELPPIILSGLLVQRVWIVVEFGGPPCRSPVIVARFALGGPFVDGALSFDVFQLGVADGVVESSARGGG